MLNNERLLELVKRAEAERCSQVMDEYSCGDDEDCKQCRIKALNLTEEEYLHIFGED